MQEVGYMFTATEILNQIHRELITLGADLKNFSVHTWKEYILARVIEDVLMVDLDPAINLQMELISQMVRSNYRREADGQIYTLHHDVGSNKLLPHLGSYDLSFESNLQLHRDCVIISPGKKSFQIPGFSSFI